MAGKGKRVQFHGAFKSKARAKRKEKKVKGFTRSRTIRGHRRFVVMTRRGK